MVRTQLQIDEATYDALRRKAHQERKSMSALVREILHEQLETSPGAKKLLSRDFSFISSGTSGRSDTSVRHDEALAEDLK